MCGQLQEIDLTNFQDISELDEFLDFLDVLDRKCQKQISISFGWSMQTARIQYMLKRLVENL